MMTVHIMVILVPLLFALAAVAAIFAIWRAVVNARPLYSALRSDLREIDGRSIIMVRTAHDAGAHQAGGSRARTVRRLARPVVQVNVARKMVNVTG